jgi:DNA-binding HxlR family transcriptional regulator
VEYSLTEKGQALIPLIIAMRNYGEKWLQPHYDETLELF